MRPGLLLMWSSMRYGNHTAIVFRNTRLSFSDFNARINRLSNALIALNLLPGHKVAVLLDNGLESATSLFAVPRSGLTYIGLNTRHSPKEHADILRHSKADAIIVGQDFMPEVRHVFRAVESLRHIIVVGNPEKGQLSYEELTEAQPKTTPEVDVDYDEHVERIQYTSGTTGKPKGVVWTFGIGYNVLTSILMNMDQPIGPGTVNLNIGPLTHAAGLMMTVYYSRGATNVILPGFDEKAVLETIEREKVTSLFLVPTMFYRLLMFPKLDSYDLSSVKRIWYGTAPMAVDKLEEGIRRFGNVFRQNYGMSEIAQPITYLGPEDHIIDGTAIQRRRLASAGLPAMGVELKVVDEDGNEVNPGEIGEILLRSNKVMKEYFNMPQETAEAFQDGWFRTRDMATVDNEGYVFIVDRKSDMIISGGFNPKFPQQQNCILLTSKGIGIKWISLYWEQSQQFKGPFL